MTSSPASISGFCHFEHGGYGDITPVAGVARMLAAAEAMRGTLFVAILISRLVSLYSSQPPKTSQGWWPTEK